MRTTDVILVGLDRDPKEMDSAVLVIARKRVNRDTVDILNSIHGKEAEELYNKLIGKKERKNER